MQLLVSDVTYSLMWSIILGIGNQHEGVKYFAGVQLISMIEVKGDDTADVGSVVDDKARSASAQVAFRNGESAEVGGGKRVDEITARCGRIRQRVDKVEAGRASSIGAASIYAYGVIGDERGWIASVHGGTDAGRVRGNERAKVGKRNAGC